MSVGKARNKQTRAAHLGPERRRPQVLDAALKLAVARGSHAVSMEAVAQAMGVTKPVVYACFASREELLEALLAREEQRLFAAVTAALPARPSFDKPERLLIEGFQALLKGAAAHADSWQLVFAANADPAVADRYKQAREQVAQQVGTLMAPGLRLWGIQDVPRKLPVLVEFFMSAGDGAVRTLVNGQGQWTPEELGALVGRIVHGALRKA
ncbi:MAG: transcriptional regulator, TetR family domain protein [Nevskia sp.]|nr:transcriptional regulator, TetR family domain protein [Nevskia sp.]